MDLPVEKNEPGRNCSGAGSGARRLRGALRTRRYGWRATFVLLVAFLLLAACARRPKPAPTWPRVGWAQRGIASWYGHPYHGRCTASGEVYDMDQLTAAHRTLPFDTWVRVRNLENGREVVVRINDRGPFVRGRIIDLSRAAARTLDMIGPGTARVQLQVIRAPERETPEFYGVQVGAFRDYNNAARLARKLEKYGPVRIVPRPGEPVFWRVIVGREPTETQAEALAERLRKHTGEAFVVLLDEGRPASCRAN